MSQSPDLPALAVTGVTGALGGLVARDLAARGVRQRLLARRPEAAPRLDGATVLPFSFDDRAASVEALRGVETLFMVSAAEDARRLEQHRAFVESAAEAGVRHVVYTSFAGASPTCTFLLGRDHHATEELLRDAGLEATFLRDNFYLDVFPYFVGKDGAIRGPAGDGRVAAVAREDVARAAAAVLADPLVHGGATYTLTGPEAFTLDEAAATIGRATGRDVRFVDETIDEARASRAGHGAPDWLVDAWISTYTAIAADELSEVTDDVRRLTGRDPLSLEQLLAAAR